MAGLPVFPRQSRWRQGKFASASCQNKCGPGEALPHYTPSSRNLRHQDMEIVLQFAGRRLDLLAKGDAVKLVEHGLVEPHDVAIGSRARGLGANKFFGSWR